MANTTNPTVNSLIFVGAVAQQASIQAQGLAGNLTLLLPNTPPVQGQILSATSVSANGAVVLGWANQQSATVALSQIQQSGATTNQIIEWNGTAWAPSSSIPGSGTVTSFTAGTLAPLFTTSVATGTTTPALTFILTTAAQNAVFAGPATGGTGAPSYRALVSADLPAISFTSLTGSIATGQIPASTITIAQINSKQGNGNAVQLTNTGATVVGDVVTYDANSNVIDSGTLLSSLASTTSVTVKPNLYSAAGGSPTTGSNFIASGTITINGVTPVAVTLTGLAIFADTNYVVQLSYNSTIGGAHTGILSAASLATNGFSIVSTDSTDTTSTVAWSAIGF